MKRWRKEESASIAEGVMGWIRKGFNECCAGVKVNWNTPNLSRGGLVVPVIACWWVDFPQHMQLVYAKHCGFCCCPYARARRLREQHGGAPLGKVG